MEEKKFVTGYGFFATAIVTVIGISIFSFPKELALYVGSDSWLITILAGIIALLIFYLLAKAVQVNNYANFSDMLTKDFGKFFGGLVAIIYSIYYILIISIGMRTFAEVIKMYLLEKTPTEFILILTILTGTYLIRGEITALIKFNEVAFWLMFVPIIIILLLSLGQSQIINIIPTLDHKPGEYLMALKTPVYAFTGISIAYMVLPVLKDKDSIKRVIMKSVIFIAAFYTIVVILCLAVFGKEQVKIILWPVITMIKSINLPASFIERWEGVAMTIWTLFYFSTFVNGYYVSSSTLKDVFKLEDIRVSLLITAPLIYIAAIYPRNIAAIHNISITIIPALSAFILIILPLILIIAGLIRKKRGDSNENKETDE